MRYFLLFLLLLASPSIWADDNQWVTLGSSPINWGYLTPYQLELQAPIGQHNLKDIRSGVQPVRFKLTWLSPNTSEADVQTHFKALIESKLETPESIQFNQQSIRKLLKKLPATKRHDVWHVVFAPDQGTLFIIEQQVVHTLIGAEVNRALYQAWLYQNPVTTAKLLKRLNKFQQDNQP
ncbi:chalcone isomerase family protein [Marinicella gelatinilytica]|uniref:chalcone isomerase family protein n=1 Tax=Marinicella gelatinilytica TaxID=2996017 RepID=UPI002260BB1C|nr:chalcone isomerase family protein [Marinicella gelatinilytica]MCX7544735.1 chalcone isomerase family protein [Marinicella gelatinilytica]